MKALQGIRMLDLTHMLSGPYAGMMLADLGADTIKIEPPETGEGTRKLLANDPRNSLHGMGAYFLTLNRNKKSITLNLKSDEGRALFYELVAVSDIVLNNFSAGVMAKLKLDYETLSQINPRIITCSITGFGETGPGKDQVAFDMVAQAMGGGMSITGQPGGSPTRSGIPIGDLGGGLMGVVGVLAALTARNTTGRGQHVDISMLDAQISLLNYMATMWSLSGDVPTMLGNAHFVHVPYNTFATQDGYIILAVIT
ncbi:MAG TPA: CoA transferase, partial [Phototrophicaceae bacterium]|nr:CoA transferase [Phototrophicaceae bacterium]